MSEAKTTALAVSGATLGAAVLPEIFRDVNFGSLSQSIETLANQSGQLSVEEKKYAINVINEWEGKVVQRLQNKNYEMQMFVRFFTIPTDTDHFSLNEEAFEAFGEEVAKRTGSTKEYEAVETARQALDAIRRLKPEKPLEDVELTKIEIEKLQSEYKLEMTKFNNSVRKANRVLFRACVAWLEKVNEHPETKDTIKRARAFERNLNKFTDDCKDKADFAKMNVAISNEETRKALRALLDFTVTI